MTVKTGKVRVTETINSGNYTTTKSYDVEVYEKNDNNYKETIEKVYGYHEKTVENESNTVVDETTNYNYYDEFKIHPNVSLENFYVMLCGQQYVVEYCKPLTTI